MKGRTKCRTRCGKVWVPKKASFAMITINSSAIRAVEYNEFTGDLTIYFQSSSGYTFHGVPWDVYVGLISASSAGSYYHRYIKGRYR